MKASEAKLLEFLKKSPQFIIPIYQRAYSWGNKECLQLWDDIIRTGKKDSVNAHFVGSIVYVEKGLYSISSQTPLLVIDGQQRLTTISLILEALARKTKDNEPIEGFSANKLRRYYLLDDLAEGDSKYKLLLSETDKDSLISILNNNDLPNNYSIRIKENFELFSNLIEKEKDLTIICKGLLKLVIVDISLNRDQDNPQLIFESLNSTGKELSQADLIRNYILMGLEHNLQSELYTNYWRPMELNFGQSGYVQYFDAFMRHYLTVKTGNIPREREVYEAFKLYSKENKSSNNDENIKVLVQDIFRFANYFCAMVLDKENDKDLKIAFKDLKELKVDVVYPFLLEIYDDFKNNLICKNDFIEIIRLAESYVFRRAVCEIPTNSMNKTFANFTKNINKEEYLESVKANFILLPSYRRFPKNEEFQLKLKTKDLYNFRSKFYWLRRLETNNRKEHVQINEYTIEHIMPQNPNLSIEWQRELGENWKEIHEKYLNTIGNLTLTGYNSEYSDHSFNKKKTIEGGFLESPLKLNKFIAQTDNWNEDSMKRRADKMANEIINVWQYPDISQDIIEKYKPIINNTNYSLENFRYLESVNLNKLYQEFRKQVLALDPCVTEEILKLYIAYKAETNFVDVTPQANCLRLILNMKFSEINDPRNICKDVTGLGRWGNGDVQVKLHSIDDMQYIISLIRQSLDKQIN